MVIYILLICAVILLNITISILINKKIQNIYYNKKMSREYVLYKFNFLRQYLLGVVVIISLFILGFASAKIMGHIGIHKSRTLSVILVWILVTFLVLLHQLILHNTYKKIRDVQLTYWDEVDITIRYLLMIFIPASIVIIGRFIILEKYKAGELLQYFVWASLIILAGILYPYIIKLLLKAKSLEIYELNDELTRFLTKHNIYRVKIYEWPAVKSREANALVAGLRGRYVFISDYLINNLTIDEIKSVLAHEIGHWKKWHLLIRLMLILLMYPVFILLGDIFDYINIYKHIYIPIPISIFIAFLALFLYFYLFAAIIRMQERSADEYVIRSGIDVNIYISALLKIAKLNDTPKQMSKIGEKLQSHPPIEKRIDYIKKVSEIIRDKQLKINN